MPLALPETAEKIEYGLSLIGLVVMGRYVFSREARLNATSSPLPAWESDPLEFLYFLFLVFVGAFVGGLGGWAATKALALKGDPAALTGGAGAQLGMLAAVGLFALYSRPYRTQSKPKASRILLSGVATFLIVLPILLATNRAWTLLLERLQVPAEPQDLIRMFAEAESARFVVALTLLATVVAPLVEESVFRAGVFRYLRTRAPRMIALTVPAIVFAGLHVDWKTLNGFASFLPLFVLALVFSIAYERTGHIGTTMIAHALFNLNTIVLIFCGVRS